jgi:hypothetical protein
MLPKKELGVSGYPTIFLVNRDGKIIYAGAADDPNLQSTIQNSLLRAASLSNPVKPRQT